MKILALFPILLLHSFALTSVAQACGDYNLNDPIVQARLTNFARILRTTINTDSDVKVDDSAEVGFGVGPNHDFYLKGIVLEKLAAAGSFRFYSEFSHAPLLKYEILDVPATPATEILPAKPAHCAVKIETDSGFGILILDADAIGMQTDDWSGKRATRIQLPYEELVKLNSTIEMSDENSSQN